MKQFFKHYTLWEDYQNGMYNLNVPNEDYLIENAVKLLSNPNQFKLVCLNVLENWKVSSLINLTNISCNRRAWLGQSACCYLNKVPEYLTRKAWANLTISQQEAADKVADEIINFFNVQNERIDNQLYLFLEE
jgi:hypothetical protein